MAQPAGAATWRPLPDDDLDAEEELRLAVVLNGGVSLAVWMGGVVLEIHRLTKRERVYGRLLCALRSRARADVVAGTSAGGINGGALALGQAYPDSDVGSLRDVWAREGSLYDLLQEPWTGSPASLLKGNAKFLPALEAAFTDLAAPARSGAGQGYAPEDRPIALTLTTTLLTADSDSLTDSLGELVFQPNHAGRFQFVRVPPTLYLRDDFAPDAVGLARRLALAARSTASFPIAFEPVHVPVGMGTVDGSPPDMAGHATFGVSRWVVDGGVLMNTPLKPVLDQITAAPASIRVRRALLLVVPDPYVPGEDEQEGQPDDGIPSAPSTVRRIVKAISTQTVAEDLRRIEEHNVRAASRRGSRTDLLRTLGSNAEMRRIADSLHPVYRDLRVTRAADAVAGITAVRAGLPMATWSRMLREHWVNVAREAEGTDPLPFTPGTTGVWGAADEAGDWQWGVATLERLAVAVQDLLKRAIWVMPQPAAAPTDGEVSIRSLRADYMVLAGRVRALRLADRAFWSGWGLVGQGDPVSTPAGVSPAPGADRHAMPATADLLASVDAYLLTWRGALAPADGATDMLQLAAGLVQIGHQAARICRAYLSSGETQERSPSDVALLEVDRLALLCQVFLDNPEAEGQEADPMSAALALEVCYLCLVETDDVVASEQVVDLVRVSAGVRQPFAPTLQARQRVAGLRMGHFASFLKQTWRVNDWIWGRLDGTNRLITLLLDPERLRRQVLLATPADSDRERARAAERANACRLLGIILGVEADEVDQRRWALVLDLMAGVVALDQGREVLAPLIDHLIEEEAEAIVREEEPALLRAVRADEAEGETPTSAGSKWRSARYAGTGEEDMGGLIGGMASGWAAPAPPSAGFRGGWRGR